MILTWPPSGQSEHWTCGAITNRREEEAGHVQFCFQKEKKSFLKLERCHVTKERAEGCQVICKLSKSDTCRNTSHTLELALNSCTNYTLENIFLKGLRMIVMCYFGIVTIL